jgi:hypothetical protein
MGEASQRINARRLPMSQKQFLLTLSVAVISGFLGGTFGVWFLMPPSVLAQDEPPKAITAEEFAVVDQKGTVRALLGTTTDGGAHLFLYDAMGTPWATLGEGKDGNGPGLRLIHTTGTTILGTVGLSITDAEGARLMLGADGLLMGGAEGASLMLRVPKGSMPFMALLDEDEKVVWSAP